MGRCLPGQTTTPLAGRGRAWLGAEDAVTVGEAAIVMVLAAAGIAWLLSVLLPPVLTEVDEPEDADELPPIIMHPPPMPRPGGKKRKR